jgi:hypothetical protein
LNSQLFDIVRSEKRAVLIGNAGTAKSMFQYYYLYRLVNPMLRLLERIVMEAVTHQKL